MTMPREIGWCDPDKMSLGDSDDGGAPVEPAIDRPGNVVTSRLPDGTHAPVLDVDLPCFVVPSSTPGRFHLYLDLAMPWELYADLIKALAAAGIVSPGYAHYSIERERSVVRMPWVAKQPSPSSAIVKIEGPF